MAYENDILTRNDNDELAVRTVQSVGDNPASSYDDIYTRDNNGKLAVRVVGTGGGGGSDPHNLGWYATQSALETAHPTATDGDWAIVGSTDTVWVWDSDNNEWKDTDQKGQVESVNGKTGAVVLNAEDVGAIPQYSTMPTPTSAGVIAQFIGTTNQNYTNGYIYKSVGGSGYIITDGELVGDSTSPDPFPTITFNKSTFESYLSQNEYNELATKDISLLISLMGDDEVVMVTYNYTDETMEYQFVVPLGEGATYSDAETFLSSIGFSVDLSGMSAGDVYSFNGYLPTSAAGYSWTRIDVQPSPVIPDPLPSQTGNSGKFLTTDGTDASWSDKPLVNTATGLNSVTIEGTVATSDQATNVGKNSQAGYRATATGQWANANANYGTAYGFGSVANQQYATSVGTGATCTGANGTATGANATAGNNSTSAGYFARATGTNCIQLGSNGTSAVTNSDNNTMKVANANGNYEMMSADGSIPSDRLIHAINKYSTMPTAASTNEGWIVQFTGTTDSTYTHGHLYECVSDGADPATYSWAEVSMGGGSGLPDQTGQSGKFLTTDGTNASWSDKPLVNKADLSDANNYSSIVVELDPMNTHASQQGVVITGGALNPLAKKYKGVLIGSGNVGYPAATSNTGVIIGYDASDYTLQFDGGGWAPVAIGSGASCRKTSVAIGWKANGAGAGTIALGANAVCNVTSGGAIQMNMDYQNQVINTDSGTFKVNNSNGNFEIMSADGTIPAARHAALPSADGTYTLQLVIADGVPTLSWVAV